MSPHHAVVHDDLKAGGACAFGGCLIDDAVLQPDGRRFDRDRLIDDGTDELRAAENADDVDGNGQIAQARVRPFSENFPDVRVDGDDAITGALKVAGNPMTWPACIRAEANHGDGPCPTQNAFGCVDAWRSHDLKSTIR